MPPAITVNDIRKVYGDTRAVDGVSFEVDDGEFFGILGPNGAGKTTTLEIIEGLREADSGEVTVLGQPPWPRNPALLPRIGVQLQAVAASSSGSPRVSRSATFAVALRRAAGEGRRDARRGRPDRQGGRPDREALRRPGASGCPSRARWPTAPTLVFLDEPTSGAGPAGPAQPVGPAARPSTSGAARWCSPRTTWTRRRLLCDRVAIMDHGKILEIGPPAALVRGPRRAHPRLGRERGAHARRTRSALFDDAEVSRRRRCRSPSPPATPAAVLAALAERNALRGLAVRGATLEDVFLHLTGREYRA